MTEDRWRTTNIPSSVFRFLSSAHGGAYGLSASWWGNGLPRLRRIAGLRERPASVELRHCPHSYGRLQSGILGNGRKP